MSEDWEFIEQYEDKLCWWRLELPGEIDRERAEAEYVCIWPEIREDGTCKFSFGTTSEDGFSYYEFLYVNTKPTLAEAKSAAEDLLTKLPRLEPK